MQHTLKILQAYEGDGCEFKATILVNCLLGLLVVPKQTSLDAIPNDPLADLSKWGISRDSIKRIGNPTKANRCPDTLRGLVYNLRNSVAHFDLKPIPRTGEVHSFKFVDHRNNKSGFLAVIKLSEMRVFVAKLAQYLENHCNTTKH